MPNFLRLNLQFFSDETHPFAEPQGAPEPHPYAADPSDSPFAKFAEVSNPLLRDYQVETPELQSTQDQGLEGTEPVGKEKLNFGGREVEVVDPIIHDLHKDYSNLNREFQQRNQELIELRQLADQWQQLAMQQAPTNQAQPTPQNNSLDIPESRLTELNEEYMERLYENKFLADKWWNEQPEIVAMNQERIQKDFEAALNERLAPLEAERQNMQAQQVADQFIQSHPDFEDYRGKMQDILNENPTIEQLPNALEVLYSMAKVQAQPKSFDDLLSDPANVQKILANEQIKNQVFQSYQQNKLQTNQQIPSLMGAPVGSQTPMSAGETAPKSLSEATRFWLRSQGQN